MNLDRQRKKDYENSLNIQAELSRQAYEATGGVRENYRNNENPNINLGGQEALKQFTKFSPLTTEMVRDYKTEEMNTFRKANLGKAYIQPKDITITTPKYIQLNGVVPTESDVIAIDKEIDKVSDEVRKLVEYEKEVQAELVRYKAEVSSSWLSAISSEAKQYIKDLQRDIKRVNAGIDERRVYLNKLSNYKKEVIRIVKDNKKLDELTSQENKEAISKYEEELRQLNMNRLNVVKQPDENEYQYYQRLKRVAETDLDEEFYKEKATLEQIRRLKENLRDIVSNESIIEGVIKKFKPEEIFEINKYIFIIKDEFLKTFGFNNKNLNVRDIVASINTIL